MYQFPHEIDSLICTPYILPRVYCVLNQWVVKNEDSSLVNWKVEVFKL